MIRSRIAPTPSGYVHLGNAVNFALTHKVTKAAGGTLALRIDDFDPERPRADYVLDIFSALRWLHIEYDEGPRDLQDFREQFSLQNKQEQLWNYAGLLYEEGKAYACECTRTTPGAFAPTGAYLGICREKKLKFQRDHHSMRLDCTAAQGDWKKSLADFVIWTKGNVAAYQLVSVVEDFMSQINLIVRGKDLEDSSGAQLYLASQISSDFHEWSKGIEFIHHRLIVDPQHPQQKLSKSNQAQSLQALIKGGYTRAEFERLLGGEIMALQSG